MNNSLPQSRNLLEPGLYKESISDPPARGEEPASILRPRRSIIALAWLIRFSAGVNLVASLLHTTGRSSSTGSAPAAIRDFRGPPRPHVPDLGAALPAGRRAHAGQTHRPRSTILALAVAPAVHLGRIDLWPQLLINGGVIGFLFMHRRYFVVGSDPRLLRSALAICPLLALALLYFSGPCACMNCAMKTSGDDDWLLLRPDGSSNCAGAKLPHASSPRPPPCRPFLFALCGSAAPPFC